MVRKTTIKAGKEILLLPNEKLIFLLSAKCGSSSIRRMAMYKLDYDKPGDPNRGLHYLQAHEVKNYPEYFKIMITRNPWARIVSLYTDKVVRTLYKSFRLFGIKRKCPFGEFVRIISRVPDHRTDPHFISQSIFIDQVKPHIVCKLEEVRNYWHFLQHALKKINDIDLPDLPHFNKKPHGPYREYYDDETRTLIAKRYRRDVELFNYAF